LVDITQPAQIARAAAALKDNQHVDILVNDAGYLGNTTEFVSHAQSDWQ
jgi:NAD(P)-dependent dehydrogenase (short-subunit alcohol dehydrogenase family)